MRGVKSYSFKGLYFTKHALERAESRNLKPSDIWAVWHNPSGSRYASSKGAFIFWRFYGNLRIEVVAKKENERWVVISVWSRRIINKNKSSLLSFVLKKMKINF